MASNSSPGGFFRSEPALNFKSGKFHQLFHTPHPFLLARLCMSIPLKNQRSATRPSVGSLYLTVWRWHFYAGIIVAPFVIFLAITGGIYLWKPQYEAWRYRNLFVAPVVGSQTSSAETQLRAAMATMPPGWGAQTF